MDSTRTTISLNGAVFLFMCGVGLITPMLPGKIYNLSQSAVQVGILAASFAFSYVIIQIPMGIWADRFGYKKFIVLGYVLCGVAGTLYLLANSSSVLIAGRVIQGLGEAPIWSLAPAILSLVNAKRKGMEIGRYNGAIHLGLTCGSLLGFIGLRFFSEQAIFQVYVFFCFISAFWIYFGVREMRVVPVDRSSILDTGYEEKLDVLKRTGVIVVLKGIALYGVGYGLFMTIVPSYISQLSHFTGNISGLLFIAFYLGIMIAQFVGGPVSDTIGRIVPMVVGLSLYSLGMILLVHTQSLVVLLLLSIASFGLGLFLVGSIAFLNDQVGRSSKGFVSGLFYFFWGGGYFFGPVIMGYMGDRGLIEYGFRAIGCLGIIIIFSIALTCRGSEVTNAIEQE